MICKIKGCRQVAMNYNVKLKAYVCNSHATEIEQGKLDVTDIKEET